MIKEAIDYLQSMAHAKLVDYDGRTYSTAECLGGKLTGVTIVT